MFPLSLPPSYKCLPASTIQERRKLPYEKRNSNYATNNSIMFVCIFILTFWVPCVTRITTASGRILSLKVVRWFKRRRWKCDIYTKTQTYSYHFEAYLRYAVSVPRCHSVRCFVLHTLTYNKHLQTEFNLVCPTSFYNLHCVQTFLDCPESLALWIPVFWYKREICFLKCQIKCEKKGILFPMRNTFKFS